MSIFYEVYLSIESDFLDCTLPMSNQTITLFLRFSFSVYFSLVELKRIKNNLFIQQSNDLRNSAKEIGVFNENNRNFNGATKDVSRDFCNSQDNTDRGSMSDQAFACSASSVESLPSASGSSMFFEIRLLRIK